MSMFVVERYLAGWSPEALHGLVQQVQDAALLFGTTGVRHVQSILLPDDETCLCVFEGPDAAAVRLANDLVGLPVDRVVPGEVVVRPGSGATPRPHAPASAAGP